MTETLAFAHRGGRAHRPENTISAFTHARALGIRAAETDAWITADGIAVLHHDGTVRTPQGLRRIATLHVRELPADVPSFSQLYAACGTDLDLAVDVMDPAAAAALVATAVAAGDRAPAHLWLCGTDLELVASWRTLHPAIHLVHSDKQWRRHRGDAGAHVETLRRHGVEVLNLHHRQCTATVAAICHARGIKLFAWGVPRAAMMRRLLRIGVDGVMSDHVDRLVKVFAPAA